MQLEHSNPNAFYHRFALCSANTIAMENMDRWAHYCYPILHRWHLVYFVLAQLVEVHVSHEQSLAAELPSESVKRKNAEYQNE